MDGLASVLVVASFVIAGLINLAPVVGVASAERLAGLYNVEVSGDLVPMMRHRAALLGLVGALLLAAVVVSELRLAAGLVGLSSMISYIVICQPISSVGSSLRRVVAIDIVASAILLVGLVVHLLA